MHQRTELFVLDCQADDVVLELRDQVLLVALLADLRRELQQLLRILQYLLLLRHACGAAPLRVSPRVR